MKTLIVDDQYQGKAEILAKILKKLELLDFEIVVSAKAALRKMKTTRYDLLIVDLQIPSDDGDGIDPQGGTNLLKFLELNTAYQKPKGVLGITSHEESHTKCEPFFKDRGWSLILRVDDEDQLTLILRTQSLHLRSEIQNFDIAIITALTHTELDAVLKLPCKWNKYPQQGDVNLYYSGSVTTSDGREKSIIATSCPRMGMAAAAAVAATVCERFSPQLVIMTGIAAGIEGKVKIGDVLIADPCWDWGSGKLTVKEGVPTFLSAPTQMPLDPGLQTIFRHIAAHHDYMNEIYSGWTEGKRPPYDPTLFVGPIATGAVVLEDPATVALILQQNRNTIGVEMEAFGIMSAVQNARCRPRALIIKSVCDYADPTKNNEWQNYAAYTSAAIAFRYITNHLEQ